MQGSSSEDPKETKREERNTGRLTPDEFELAYAMHLVQKEYGWKDSYIIHNWRKDTDYLSYERWIQILEVLKIVKRDEEYQKWKLAAYGWWNDYQNNLEKKPKPYIKNADEFLRKIGLRDPNIKVLTRAEEIAKAYAEINPLLEYSMKAKWTVL